MDNKNIIFIEEEDVVITLTHHGYVKRLPTDTYRAQRRGGRGISGMATREEDFVKEIFTTSTHNYILFFTNRGRMFKIKGYQIPESGRTAKGTPIVNLLSLDAGEKVQTCIPLKSFEDGKFLTMVTKKGTVKKTDLNEYNSNRTGGLRAINLVEDDELITVELTDGDKDIVIGTYKGMAIRFSETDIRPMGRVSQGVRGIKLKSDDYVIGSVVATDGSELLIVSENGMGKRSLISEYKVQNRGGQGVRTYKINEKTGNVAGIQTVSDDYDIMLITSEGVIIRTGAESISTLRRDTSGVKIMKLDDGVKVVSVATILKEEETEEELNEENTAEAEVTEE